MLCPKCNGKSKMKDGYLNKEFNEAFRLRECESCGHEFWTVEFSVTTSDKHFKRLYKNKINKEKKNKEN